MRVSKINLINSQNISIKNVNNKYSSNLSGSVNKSDFAVYNGENLKANFMPSFSGARKVGKVEITERETGKQVQADVKKDIIGPYVKFTVNAGRKELGFLTMNCDSLYPVAQHVITLPTDNIPQVTNLRTIEGDKYSGVGTALIKTAIQESYNNKSYGNLWLNAERGYERTLSSYRSNENPIPFYYKMGFQSPEEEIDCKIKQCLKEGKTQNLPEITTLLLTSESRDKWLKDIFANPVMKIKNPRLAG